MKRFIILASLLILSLCISACGGGGSGSSNSPSGENRGTPSDVQLLPSHFIAQTNAEITLHTKVLDGNGDPVRNVLVRFTNLSGIGALLNEQDVPLADPVVQTDASGLATVRLKSTMSGFITVQAEIDNGIAIIRDRKTMFFASTLNLSPTLTLEVDGDNDGIFGEQNDFVLFENENDNQVMVRAKVYDQFGLPASFVSVTFGSDTSEATFPLGRVVTANADGEVSVMMQASPMTLRDIQTVLNVSATAENGAFNLVSLFLRPITISKIELFANPQIVESGGSSTITANVLTSVGTPAPSGTTVNFRVSPAGAGGIEPFVQTTSGRAEAEFKAAEVLSDLNATITAKVGNVTSSPSLSITVKAPPIDPPDPVALSITPPSVSIIGAEPFDTVTFTIIGGTAPYTITSSDPNRAFNDTSKNGAWDPGEQGIWTGSSIIVTIPLDAPIGTVTLTVSDGAGGATAATITIL